MANNNILLTQNELSVQFNKDYYNANDEFHKIETSLKNIVNIVKNDLTHENANMAANTSAGQMMNVASFMMKDFAFKNLMSPKYAQAHLNGDIHIHDVDYYPSKTTTCLQYNLNEIFKNGFWTKNGFLREPQTIQSYATLATIIFQTHQNEQHGGQAIPAFYYYMAPGVLKSYRKHLVTNLQFLLDLINVKTNIDVLSEEIELLVPSIELSLNQQNNLMKKFNLTANQLTKLLAKTFIQTQKDTFQAMEGFIHNLNTMHSRGGNQVVFSSINYGTDTSPEGRMVIRELLLATQKGLGKSETPIFPIQIFKVKDGISYSEEDYQLAMQNWTKVEQKKQTFKAKNFDLLIEACITNSTRLFPNFLFLDATFNQHSEWNHNLKDNYRNEVATMGCRTRVFENINGPKTSVSRGNNSFTTMNLPRLAILARQTVENSRDYHDLSQDGIKRLIEKIFFDKVREQAKFIAEQLKERYDFQRTALAKQFPFLIQNNTWNYAKTLNPDDFVGDLFKQGTLGIGFIGGHNAMQAIYGVSHNKSTQAYKTLYKAVEIMNEVADEYKTKYHLNYSVLATPAEGLSGRFTKMDKKKFGIIKGINDRGYYVNSFHINVAENISIFEKIKKEAPFHALTLGGHITYVELDGILKYNIPVILKIVKTMYDNNIGYGSINHPVDTCLECGFTSVINDICPKCSTNKIRRIRRITGYLTGDLSSWNSAKQSEEEDRVKHDNK